MVRKCCIANCHYSMRDKRNLFVMPKSGEQHQKWLDAISPHMLKGRQHRKHLYVCDAHFNEDDILRKRVILSKDGPIDEVPCFSIRLKPASIPSIFDTGVPPTMDLPAAKNNKSNTLTSETSGATKVSKYEGAKDIRVVPKEKTVPAYTLKMLENELQLWWEKNDISIWKSLMISTGLLISFFGENSRVATKTILVKEDMSTEIRAAGLIFMENFTEKIKSVDDMLSLMSKLKINHLCRGSDSSMPCPNGYFESSTPSVGERCFSCQIERKKKLNCLLRAKKRAIWRANRDKQLIKKLKQKIERLVRNMASAKENIKQLRAQYALAWNAAIKIAKRNFPSTQQKAIEACRTTAQ